MPDPNHSSAMPFPFDGIILDMDGVLVDSEPFIIEAATQMFRETHGIHVHADDFRPFFGAGEDRFLGGVAEKHGVSLTMPRDKNRTYETYLQKIKGRLQPLPGAVEFVKRSRQRGFKLALASSADRIKVDGNLTAIGLDGLDFDAIITGSDVERKKPDPEIFLLAATRLALPPNRCLVIEDATNGVRAAKAAGCWCMALTTTFSEQAVGEAGADIVVKDLAHVPREISGEIAA